MANSEAIYSRQTILRMGNQAATEYWRERVKTELRQLNMLKRQLETLQRKIEKQGQTWAWATSKLAIAEMRLEKERAKNASLGGGNS